MSRRKRFTKHDTHHQLAIGDNRVVSYVRRSTEDQANSLDAQRRRHEDFAAGRDLLIDETFKGDGVSATSTDFLARTEVKAMLKHMKARGIRTILLLRVDRVFRRTQDFHLSMVELQKHGIFLRFIDPDIDYSTPIGQMMIQQQVMMAQYEGQLREQRQDDANESLREKRVAITANAIPYGWLPNGHAAAVDRTGKPKIALKPHLEQQVILRWIKDQYQRDHSYGCWTRIASQLNAWGIPTKKGSTWKAANVQSVLRHEILITEDELGETEPPTLEEAIQALSRKTTITQAA